MRYIKSAIAAGLAAITISVAAASLADTPSGDVPKLPAGQKLLELPVHVVDADGKPVAKAKVTPWALRSSQGHGWWKSGDKAAGVGPQEVMTDDNGSAVVAYPAYRDIKEHIRTIGVSLNVDHPDFAYSGSVHIDVPLESSGPYEVKLTPGVLLEIRPLIGNQPADLNDLFVLWSDGRSWRNGSGPQKTTDGTLRMPAMAPGKNSVLLVKLDGDRATHFSKITDLDLKAGEENKVDIELRPGLRIEGSLSDNVARPVREGRLKIETLNPADAEENHVSWFSWAPIKTDGTFVIDGWPADERMQLIALCDGYIATTGKAPDSVKNPPDPNTDFFKRPQVFPLKPNEKITVALTPLARCEVTVVDQDNAPLPDVTVHSWPNVCWWNSGSQVYCDPLIRSERLLRNRDWFAAVDDAFPEPFHAKTDSQGKATLQLPKGKQHLAIASDAYELPAFLGRRDIVVELVPDQTTQTVLRLQPRGTEKLGEWDKLAGVVFGCTTREGRQICAQPSVRAKMDEFEKRFREAKNQNDPQLLSEAYATVCDAFTEAGDPEEAAKWRHKAEEQAAKAAGGSQSGDKQPAK